ncbi:MAG TPA: hypothetical protein PKI46_05930 [Bacteroidales bacterium]|nr:hypothetical protein [Bacteroidales bacterium]
MFKKYDRNTLVISTRRPYLNVVIEIYDCIEQENLSIIDWTFLLEENNTQNILSEVIYKLEELNETGNIVLNINNDYCSYTKLEHHVIYAKYAEIIYMTDEEYEAYNTIEE